MKNIIVKANAGALTNFEVLDLFNSRRGASKDTTRVKVSTSEYKVYDYLMETAASTQTRESVIKFFDKCKDLKLAKAEILNIINLRPCSDVELTPILEKPDEREIDLERILELVQELLPPLPTVETFEDNEQEETEKGEESDNEQEETENGEQSDNEQEETENGEQSDNEQEETEKGEQS